MVPCFCKAASEYLSRLVRARTGLPLAELTYMLDLPEMNFEEIFCCTA